MIDPKPHGRAKLRPHDIRTIRASSMNNKRIAEIYGVHRATVGFIRRGVSWKGVKQYEVV
jgi:hypothetical protein